MKTSNITSPLLLLGLISACDLPDSSVPTTSFAGTGHQYYSAEVRVYNTAYSCPSQAPLNGLSSALRDQMAIHGWWPLENIDLSESCDPASTNWQDHCPIPTDFVDSLLYFGPNDPNFPNLKGEDHKYADASIFTFFAGHGQQGVLSYRRPAIYGQTGNPVGTCIANWDDQHVRLGYSGGSKSRVAAFAASCFGYMPDSLAQLPTPSYEIDRVFGSSTTWQHLVFFDSPNIGDNGMGSFIECLSKPTGQNWGCWMSQALYNDPSSFTDHNEPVIYTTASQSETLDQLQVRHENANLLTLSYLPNTLLSTFGQKYQFSSAIDLGNPNITTLEFDPTCVDLIGS